MAVLVSRKDVASRWLVYLSPVSIVLVAHFLLLSPASVFVLASESGPASLAPPPGATSPPIVMLVLDELGTSSLLDGHGTVDAELYPSFAALADTSTWYRNTTTVASATPAALAGLLSGEYPGTTFDSVGVPGRFGGSLFSLFGETHEVRAFEPLTTFCYESPSCTPSPHLSTLEQVAQLGGVGAHLFGQVLDPRSKVVTLPVMAAVRDGRDPSDYVERFLASMDSTNDSADPSLHFLHLLSPHAPYTRLPSGRRHGGCELGDGAPSWQGPWPDDEVAWRARQRHTFQLQNTDRLLGEIVDHLRAQDRFDDTLLVVTADHGSAFLPGAFNRTMNEENQAHIAWVPLFIKAPGQQRGVVDDDPVELVAVVPMLAELTRRVVPWDVDGAPAGARRGESVATLARWPGLTALGEGDQARVTIDRADGFERVLAYAPMGTPGTAAQWRPYQRGRYASLLGSTVSDLRVEADGPAGAIDVGEAIVVEAGSSEGHALVTGWVEPASEVAVASMV